jgi:predicted MPP superfamily phosphohydrolase
VFGSIGAYGLFLAWQVFRHFRAKGTRPLDAASATSPPPAAEENLTRRQLLAVAGQGALLVPFGVAGYGTFIGRRDFQLVETELKFPDLPADLDGVRLAQISDLHFGKYFTPADLEHVIGMVNETRPQVALVTGDLITGAGDPLERCIDLLSGLRADAGIRACMGNHEIYARSQNFTAEYGHRKGVEFLRQKQEELRFGGATLNLCGVDYQRKSRPYLAGADALVRSEAFNVLLSHNPDVLPVASRMGYDLVIGGHTHGGQITIEIVDPWANPGRFFTPFVSGEYKVDQTILYVSRGVGTVTLPMRIGALPEVSLLTLRRA